MRQNRPQIRRPKAPAIIGKWPVCSFFVSLANAVLILSFDTGLPSMFAMRKFSGKSLICQLNWSVLLLPLAPAMR